VAYYTLNNLPMGELLPVEVQAMASAYHQHVAPMAAAGGQATEKSRATSSAKPSATSAKHQTTMPASWKAPDQQITIGTRPNLKFSQELVEVKAGSKVKLTFTNDDDMLHNFVLLEPGTALEVGTQAMQLGLDGQRLNYVPETNKVLYHTLLLQPESVETIYFTAPSTPGDYPFVCTVPGHFYVMQGKLRVVR
jgi:uncharacterized cupredoxin-like copper-binding protein